MNKMNNMVKGEINMCRKFMVVVLANTFLLFGMATQAHDSGGNFSFTEGSGIFQRQGQNVIFGIAVSCSDSGYVGHFQFKDEALGMRMRHAVIENVYSAADYRIIEGYGTLAGIYGHNDTEGIETAFRIGLADNGEPGAGVDTIWVEFTSGYYTTESELLAGNISFHTHVGDDENCADSGQVMTSQFEGGTVSGKN